jgi:hypothetical protein
MKCGEQPFILSLSPVWKKQGIKCNLANWRIGELAYKTSCSYALLDKAIEKRAIHVLMIRKNLVKAGLLEKYKSGFCQNNIILFKNLFFLTKSYYL